MCFQSGVTDMQEGHGMLSHPEKLREKVRLIL